jgi:hypothetical protein
MRRNVTVDELPAMVNVALGNADPSTCLAGDGNLDLQVTIDDILAAVSNALNGCPAAQNSVVAATSIGGRP